MVDEDHQNFSSLLEVEADKDQFNKVKKLSKRDIGGGSNYEPSIDQLFARRQKVHMVQ